MRRATHDAVFASCTTELLERNTFHAPLEATKGLADRVRFLTGYTIDGAKLATETLYESPGVVGFGSTVG